MNALDQSARHTGFDRQFESATKIIERKALKTIRMDEAYLTAFAFLVGTAQTLANKQISVTTPGPIKQSSVQLGLTPELVTIRFSLNF